MFSKARYEYIKFLLDSYEKRNESLEKKSTFLFSIISIFIVGIFLQFEKIGIAIDLLKGKSTYVKITLICGAVCALLGIFIALYFVLNSMRVRKFLVYWPPNPVSTLFSPESRFFPKQETESDFYNEMGDFLASRLEYNHSILQKKANNIKNAWISLVFTLFLLIVVAILFTLTIKS